VIDAVAVDGVTGLARVVKAAKGSRPQTDGVKANGVGRRPLRALSGTTYEPGVGMDVSLEASTVCVVDGNGNLACQGKIISEPDALIAW
jgi:hypothetical protein